MSQLDNGRICTHDVRALLSLTFETAEAADEYAVRMAKAWIEDRDYATALLCHVITKLTG